MSSEGGSGGGCPFFSAEAGGSSGMSPASVVGSKHRREVTYREYINTDKLLSLQTGFDNVIHSHEEHLFIVVHEAFELWFKQIIWDMQSILDMFSSEETLSSKNALLVGSRLRRMSLILRSSLANFEILETMHPCEFHEFRDFIGPASGFQSHQMRVLETMLGLKDKQRFLCGKSSYMSVFDEDQKEVLLKLKKTKSLAEVLEDFLQKMDVPASFVENFLKKKEEGLVDQKILWFGEEKRDDIEKAAKSEMEKVKSLLEGCDIGQPEVNLVVHLQKQEDGSAEPELGPEEVEEAKQRRCRARVAALFLHSYRDEPSIRPFSEICDLCVAFEQAFLLWRHRHARMVEVMIGRRVGTGGSAGVEYLDATCAPRVFVDLWQVRTMLMKNSTLEPLDSL